MGKAEGFGGSEILRFVFSSCIGLFICTCLPTLAAGKILPNCSSQDCYDEWLNERRDEALNRIMYLGNTSRLSPEQAPSFSIAYYNSLTDEFFVGDRAFHRDDDEAALATRGLSNTQAPSGIGWRPISETEYIGYMRLVLVVDTPVDQTIYNNCVVAKSRDASESVLREVRASCRETARNPSRLDRWRWGD
jgi:hypothetical protein